MNYYDLLGVSPEASFSDIRISYLDLAKRYHPDVNGAKNANYLFIQIKEAYETLSNPVLREEYDRTKGYKYQTDRQNSYSKARPEKSNTNNNSSEWENSNYRNGNKTNDRSTSKSKSIPGWEIGIAIAFFLMITFFLSNANYSTIPSESSEENIAIQIVREMDSLNPEIMINSNPQVVEVYGWMAKKVNEDIYFVTKGYDYDNDINNGYKIFAYEVDIYNRTARRIKGSVVLERKYETLGYRIR